MIIARTYWIIGPILDGTKSQTRRFHDPKLKVGSIHVVKRFPSDRTFAKVRIRGVRTEPLGAVTDEDARAEGNADRADILRQICRSHANRGTLGKTPREWIELLEDVLSGRSMGPTIWVIDFELVSKIWDPSREVQREMRSV